MIAFRQYQPSDAEAVWNLHVESLRETGAYLEGGSWYDDLRQISQVYLDQRGEFLVGHDGERLIAMGAVMQTGPERAELKRMRIHRDYQGQGLGQRMLGRLEERARELGYALLHLDTSVKQQAALHLYLKNGYHETHRDTIQGLEIVYFEKPLGGNG